MTSQDAHTPSTPTLNIRGRKRKVFEHLTDRTKDEYCRISSKNESLEKTLRCAEKLARNKSFSAMAKVLSHLTTAGEKWAIETLKAIEIKEKFEKPCVESSLMLKTRLNLSKRMYIDIASFMKDAFGIKILPWSEVMEHRNQIIPNLPLPTFIEEDNLHLSIPLRDLLTNSITRILEIEEVSANLSKIPIEKGECVLHISAGVDSATGFAHYSQEKIVRKDDSLLSEHVMPLMFVSGDTVIWNNPNPQSDKFCRARSMTWMKEKDTVTRNMFTAFYEEVENIENHPIIINSQGIELSIKVSAIYALVDGKAANAISGNRYTHACPLCVAGADSRLGPSYFHSRLNLVEWLLRVAAQKKIPGHPAQSSHAVKSEERRMADELERILHTSINRPKIGGSGSSNTGNLARNLLAIPEKLSDVLEINLQLVRNIRMLSCLALSSHKLEREKVRKLYEDTHEMLLDEFPFVQRLPPCFHKYSHMPDFIDKLVKLSVSSLKENI